MTDEQSNDYFLRRAEEERLAADRAADERAAQSHRDLSNEYRKLASGDAPRAADDEAEAGIVSRDFRIVP